MELEQRISVLITGAGSGIGRALAVALAKKGTSISVLDIVEKNALETLEMVKQEYEKLQVEDKPSTICIRCDVAKPDEISSAFEQHIAVFKSLDICINCAGVAHTSDFIDDEQGLWRRLVDVNLNGTIECTRLEIKAMKSLGKPGCIINFASALGLYPAPCAPIYAASKAGVVMLTRSLVNLRSEGIRVNAVCPEFVDTPMGNLLPVTMIDAADGFIPMEKVNNGVLELIEDESKAGCCLWITQRHGVKYWPCSEEEQTYSDETICIFGS
ncbi:hypothetical protein SELMODRAFT_142659 [Selaginella moellendorffii]|uniref:Uncharacterized protein n=1 Tax=Selaginella moellendorffii TaxID=88036 RepID=D8R0M2_SELML|nr:15-hydroxyprostaglandin dehydrogenase [NAD(+)] [Selaginella moellendorffii]EFJ35000.1 hypothetical protein SELMODRAFT_142659 [Selaginella moellendorffii]|eukprot:XP_002964667.1 15-hydroxyprostaglandin dehydrogenase [NAD(+)] [Selaginella moellendorffii]